jgi:hypothetical protein
MEFDGAIEYRGEGSLFSLATLVPNQPESSQLSFLDLSLPIPPSPGDQQEERKEEISRKEIPVDEVPVVQESTESPSPRRGRTPSKSGGGRKKKRSESGHLVQKRISFKRSRRGKSEEEGDEGRRKPFPASWFQASKEGRKFCLQIQGGADGGLFEDLGR